MKAGPKLRMPQADGSTAIRLIEFVFTRNYEFMFLAIGQSTGLPSFTFYMLWNRQVNKDSVGSAEPLMVTTSLQEYIDAANTEVPAWVTSGVARPPLVAAMGAFGIQPTGVKGYIKPDYEPFTRRVKKNQHELPNLTQIPLTHFMIEPLHARSL